MAIMEVRHRTRFGGMLKLRHIARGSENARIQSSSQPQNGMCTAASVCAHLETTCFSCLRQRFTSVATFGLMIAMKISSTIAAFLALAGLAHGANLLTNANFETGSFAPWTVTGDAEITSFGANAFGMHNCGMVSDLDASGGALTAKLEQTVPTTAGALYYLAIDVLAGDSNGFTLFAIGGAPANGGGTDGSRVIEVSNRFEHYTLIFRASTASTKVVIEMAGSIALVDNLQLIELPPSKRAGEYTGTAKTVLRSPGNTVANAVRVHLSAKISSTGQIVLLEGVSEFAAGILLPDGTLDIRLRGGRRVFDTTIQAGRITFVLEGTDLNMFDEGLNEVIPSARTTYTLTRVNP